MANILEEMMQEISHIDLKYFNKKYFKDRDSSWLDFNARVVFCSINKSVPIGERGKFFSIAYSNLDEFTMVRLSKAKLRALQFPDELNIIGITNQESYNLLLHEIKDFRLMQMRLYGSIVGDIISEVIPSDDITRYFIQKIYPLITPLSIDNMKEFPLICSKELTLWIHNDDDGNESISFIPIQHLDRIVTINNNTFLIEDVIVKCLPIVTNTTIKNYGTFRLLREAEISITTNESKIITNTVRDILNKRTISPILFMEINSFDTTSNDITVIRKLFNVDKDNYIVYNTPLDYRFISDLDLGTHKYPKFKPQQHPLLVGESSIIDAIISNDMILHHPYQSYDGVIRLLEESANDPDVIAIRQTLYRVSSTSSPIVNGLCKAAKNGKQVSVLLEITARFDEEQNLALIHKLRNSGCRVIHGIPGLKSHCKFISIVKQSPKTKKLKLISHIATGNYNDTTAKLYTDISYFTSNKKIGYDLISIFNILSGISEPHTLNELAISPHNLRSTLVMAIENEIKFAKKGKFAEICIKVNSFSDVNMNALIYKAAEAGVKIKILCRGICSLRTRHNIEIRSIIGRFLEHSRIYCFHNNGDPKVYISSADILYRNLNRRVEILAPIVDENCKHQVLDIFNTGFMDRKNCFKLDKRGKWMYIGPGFDSFQHFIDNNKQLPIPQY